MWELVLLTKAKTLKTIEKKHGIQVEHPSCANSDESFMDLVDEYAIETVHPAIEQLIDVYRELKTKVIMYECSVPHRCGPPVVTMALNQTRSMYANVLIKQQPESGNVVVLAESKTLTLDAIATFAVLIGLRSAEYVTSAVMLRHGYRDQFVIPSSLMKRWNASRCSEEYTACDESTHNDSDVDDDDEGEVAMETDPAEESGSGNNDSESSMETDQPEQSHSSSVDGPSNDPWETINPKNTSSNHAPDSTPDNTNKLDNLKTDNFLARDVNQDSDGESERFRSKDPKFEGATSSLNVRLADPIAEPHHHGPSQTVSENTGRFLGTETYGLTESETNNAVEFPTKDEKRISHGPSQPSSGKLLLSMNKKKHLTGHDKEGLQKLTFDCSSGKLEVCSLSHSGFICPSLHVSHFTTK